jgi:hypothetical protein
MTPSSELTGLAGEWKEARTLYPLYAALGREFVIELPACPDLETGIDAPPKESVELARQWLLEVDERIQVHQLRQFLQTTPLSNDEALRSLLIHHLHKPKRSDSDRDKVDFLLVQYFSNCVPSRLDDADVDLEYVAQTLEPILGSVDLSVPEWLKPLDGMTQQACECKDLKSLLTGQLLANGREIKIQAAENYYLPVAMVAFTRFSFMMRRVFFRLLHQDMDTILAGLRTLEQRGVTTIDCRRAQFSAEESIPRLRMICQSWKVMFFAEYSSGQPVNMLVDLRLVIERALTRSGGTPARAQSAAAGAGAADAPEFEVSTAPPSWPSSDSDK